MGRDSPDDLAATAAAPPDVIPHGPVLVAPELSDLEVRERLGSGGMGVVYLARDHTLERDVAVKLIRPDMRDVEGFRARLLREARAQSKVVHPNVVTVHGAGVTEDQIYIVMEYVEGGTLADWLKAGPRTTREILDVFCQAGRGLAAAHGAGLVHRDFKPANVLVGRDGRARVTDFGLAVLAAARSEPAEPPFPSAPLSPGATVPGAVMGTPHYMAPEQHEGAAADVRSDQYAFATSVWEALHGAPPFPGTTTEQLHAAKRGGRLPDPLPGVRVPGRIRAALARALLPDPAARHASMTDLLAILEVDPAGRRRRGIALLATALVAGGGALVLVRAIAPDETCGGIERKLAGIWDPTVKARVAAGFAATGRPYADEAARRVAERLDGYFADLAATHVATCEATVKRKEQSPALLDLRMRCLDGVIGRAGALIRLLADAPTPPIVDRSLTAVAGLGDAGECARAERPAAAPPLPADPETRKRIAGVEADFAQASALGLAGQYKAAVDKAAAAQTAAGEIAFVPLVARAAFETAAARGHLDSAAAEAAYRKALALAAELGDDDLAARSWLGLVTEVADGERWTEAEQLVLSLDLAVARAGGAPVLRAQALGQAARVQQYLGHLPEAQALAERAVAEAEKGQRPNVLVLRAALKHVAGVMSFRKNFAGARQMNERILLLTQAIEPPDHPNVAVAESNLGGLLCEQGETVEGERRLRRALDIRKKVYGAEHSEVANSLNNLGFCADMAERSAESKAYFEQALALGEKLWGKDSPRLYYTLIQGGAAIREGGHYDEARAWISRAMALAREGSPEEGWVHHYFGTLESMQHHYAEAIPHFERALAVFDKISPGELQSEILRGCIGHSQCMLGKAEGLALLDRSVAAHAERSTDSEEHLSMEIERSRCRLQLGRSVDTAELERLLDLHKHKPRHYILGQLRFVLARALRATDRARAIELARAAQADFEGLERGGAIELVDVKTWLASAH